MPVAFDSGSNTSMLLDVAGSVQQRRPVTTLTFPALPPEAFGIMACDVTGTISWLEQYVSALTPDPSYNYFFTGPLDSTGLANLSPDRPMLLRPYGQRVLYAVHFKCRAFNASEASAVFVQGAVSYDPSQPVGQQWSSSVDELYGDSSGMSFQLILTRVLPPAVSVTLQVSASSYPGGQISIDAIVYYPIELPR